MAEARGVIEFFIPGQPRPKGRPRFNPKSGRAYTPKDTVVWERHIMGVWDAQGLPAIIGPLEVTVKCVFERPKSHFRANGISLSKAGEGAVPRADVDNLVKPVLDALNGRAFEDDRFVTALTATKEWGGRGVSQGVRVTLRPLNVLRHDGSLGAE